MSQLILDPVLSGYNLAKVNDNFKRIEEAFNTLLLHKDGSKALTSDLDVNSQKLLNVGGIEIGGVDLLESITSLQETYSAYVSEMEAYKSAVEDILDEAISYGAVDKKSIGNAQVVFTTNQVYAKNSNLTLPLKYIVGKNTLRLSLGHTYLLYKGVDYEEVGVVGEESQTIKIIRASGISAGVTIEQVVDGDNDLIEIFENAQSLYTLLTTNYSPTKVEEFINSVSDVKELGIEDKVSELWDIYNNLSALQVSFANTVADINTKYSTITDMYEDVSTKYSVLETLYPQLVALITDTNFDLDGLNAAVANILSAIQELQALTGTIESNAQTASTAATSASTSAETSSNNASLAANSATKAQIWAEGTDTEVEGILGEHSSKGWAEEAKRYATGNIIEALGYTPADDADLGALDAVAVKHTEQTLTTTQQAQARTNIDAVSSVELTAGLATKQGTLTFDTTPTANSSNPVTSGGIKTALDAKQDTLTFDSTPTADSNNPVTSQGIKAAIDAKDSLPSQTGNAGKVLATDGTAASWIEPPSGRQILETFYTFRTDVGPINGAYDANGTVYNRSDFSGGQNPYDLLVAGKAKSCSFAEYETQLSTYGSCGLFGLDTETQRFRVPTLKNILEPTVLSSAIGQIVEAGLPNITGKFIGGNPNGTISGAFKKDSESESTQQGSDYHESQMSFDASLSSPVYGKSTTVQPQTIKVRPMVQLATRGQEISIEQYSNQLADYAQTYTLNGRIIGEFIWAGLPLTNAGVHLLDGSEISNSGIYTQFVSYISSCFENQNPQAKWLKTKGITLPTFTSNIQDDITISDARGNTTNLQAIFNGSLESVSIGPWSTYWISVDYAKNTFLSSYTIQADNTGDPEYPSDWTLQGSNDGTAWTDIHSKTSIVFTLDQAKTFSVDQTVPYKQYRLLFSNGVVEKKGNGELKKVSFNASEVEFGYENSMFATEEQWQTCVAKYGSCGKFVVTSSGVRLPKVSDILQGTTDATAVGDLIEAGLPNITGRFGFQIMTGDSGDDSGAITSEGLGNGNLQYVSSGTYGRRRLYINASRSSPYYKDSVTKPTPQTIKSLLYICVANSVKTQIQVDIDNIATDLNGKADRDLSNVTAPVLSAPYVVEEWHQGTEWYRAWSTGFIEQGGFLALSGVGAFEQQVTFRKAFTGTSYVFKPTGLITRGMTSEHPNSRTTTGVKVSVISDWGAPDPTFTGISWSACGY